MLFGMQNIHLQNKYAISFVCDDMEGGRDRRAASCIYRLFEHLLGTGNRAQNIIKFPIESFVKSQFCFFVSR